MSKDTRLPHRAFVFGIQLFELRPHLTPKHEPLHLLQAHRPPALSQASFPSFSFGDIHLPPSPTHLAAVPFPCPRNSSSLEIISPIGGERKGTPHCALSSLPHPRISSPNPPSWLPSFLPWGRPCPQRWSSPPPTAGFLNCSFLLHTPYSGPPYRSSLSHPFSLISSPDGPGVSLSSFASREHPE